MKLWLKLWKTESISILLQTWTMDINLVLFKTMQSGSEFHLFNSLKTKRRLLYLKTQSVPHCKHFSTRL